MEPDAKLLRRVAKFKAADDRRRNATAKTAELEAELDRLGSRIRKAEKKETKEAAADRVEELEGLFQNAGHRHFHDDMLAAELKQDRLTEAADDLARAILDTRASTPAGMMVKLRVNDTWPGTYEDDELLASLVADIRAIAAGDAS